MQSPFSNGNSPTQQDPLTGDGRFTYINSNLTGGAAAAADVSAVTAAAAQASGSGDVGGNAGQATLAAAAGGSQFYVMMSPQDVLQVNTITVLLLMSC